MDEMMWLRLFGGALGSGVDLAVIIAFVAFAVLYFLAPVVGYDADRRVGMLAALYLLTADVALAVVGAIIQWMLVLERAGPGGMGSGEWTGHIMLALGFAKAAVFLAAMLTFVGGLRALRRDPTRFNSNPPYGIGR